VDLRCSHRCALRDGLACSVRDRPGFTMRGLTTNA
jgi:hypothetical protein